MIRIEGDGVEGYIASRFLPDARRRATVPRLIAAVCRIGARPAEAGGMAQRSVLITGCSSGIGLDAARGLQARGWRVFATCRQEADCDRLRAEGLESFVLDYADEASIAAALDEALARTGGRLDAVFNNGAFACPGAVEDLPTRGAARDLRGRTCSAITT